MPRYPAQRLLARDVYWRPFQKFSDTAVSEADGKVREFLNLDYICSRDGDRICVDIENLGETASLILRTHGEKIKEVSGASYEQLEEDAYLLHAEEAQVVIEVGSAYLLDK